MFNLLILGATIILVIASRALNIPFEYTVFMGIIGVILYLGSMYLKIRNREYKMQIADKYNLGKENFKERVFLTKEKIRYLKENSPLTLVLVSFSIFIVLMFRYLEGDYIFAFFLMFSIFMPLAYYVMKKILDFNYFFEVGLNRNNTSVWEMSGRATSQYRIKDESGYDSILVAPFVCKRGKGYYVNEIDHKERIIVTNMLHNDISAVQNIKRAFLSMRKKAVEIANKNGELMAVMPFETMVKASNILEKISTDGQLIEALEKEILELDKIKDKEYNKGDSK